MGQQAHVSPEMVDEMHLTRTLDCLLLLQHMMVIGDCLLP